MQIVTVAHSYPRRDGDVAGAFIQRLALALSERKHLVKVVAPAERGRGIRERQRGISVSRVRYAPARWETLAYAGTMADRARMPLGMLLAGSLTVAQAREIGHLNSVARVDIVHAHWWVPGGVSAWLARMTGKTPYMVTLHGTDVAILNQSWVGRAVARRVLRGAAAVTAVSSYLAQEVASLAGLDPGRILVQPMPVDVDRFTTTSQGGGGVVVVGRLTRQKNVDAVLEAVARLRKQGREIGLRIIGDGPRRQVLEYRARGLGIDDRTDFVGTVPPDRLPQTIGDADVMVFPALREGFGLAAAEALLLGIPVVATHEGGGVSDIVPPTGAGRLVAAEDPVAMARAIGDFVDDPVGRRLAREAGQSLRRRLDPAAVAQVFESEYEKALGRMPLRRAR